MHRSLMACTRWVSPAAALLLYGISLSLPAVAVNGRMGAVPARGYEAVLAGLFALVFLFQPAVLANPAILLSSVLLTCRRWRAATFVGAFALACALSTFLIYDPAAPPQGGGADTPNIHPPRIIELWAGYYCWLGSATILVAGGALGMRMRGTVSDQTTGISPSQDGGNDDDNAR